MVQFLDSEIAKILQFLDPEIVKMDDKNYGWVDGWGWVGAVIIRYNANLSSNWTLLELELN